VPRAKVRADLAAADGRRGSEVMRDTAQHDERQIAGGFGGTSVAPLKWVRPLFTRRWLLVTVFALVLPMQALGQTDTSETTKPVDAAGALRPGVLVDTFGKWEVRKGLIDNTYLLVGESAANGEGHFWLHCDQNNLITVAIPLIEHPGSDRLRSHAITIRADTGLERVMSFIVFDNFVAVAIDYEGARNDKVADFLDVLHAAKETVTISYADRSFDYDVAQLPAAQSRFQELCNRSVR
jgi:hypothetical protein